MRREVIIGEAGNLVGIELDPPGGSAQRVVFGIGAELGNNTYSLVRGGISSQPVCQNVSKFTGNTLS
jgi:hypothetical protein